MKEKSDLKMKIDRSPERREFMKTSAAVGAGLLILPAKTVFGSTANSMLGIGIIGCGGRGNHDGGEFVMNTETRVTALMDVFDDRLASTRAAFDEIAEQKGYAKIPEANLFKGPKAYEKLVQSKDVDIVIVTSPPYFHPEHFEAAVAAGKHVYLEKPVATDVNGCMRVIKAGRQANGKVSVHVGFQKRYSDAYREAVRRIRQGDIGDVVLGQSYYYTNDLDRQNKPGMSGTEARLRNWVFDRILSGDIIVEQNIHIIDVVNWVMQAHPVKAMGTGGRAVRKEVDGIPPELVTYDHYILTFVYPNDIKVSFNSNQFRNRGYRSQGERFFGTKGVAETNQSGPVQITLNSGYKWEAGTMQALATAVANKARAFVDGINKGKFDNEAEQGAETTLTTIMGRTAAYRGEVVTWEQVANSDEKWDPKLNLDALGGSTTSMK